jgi:DnaJ-class molecular chaperone
MDIKYKYIPKCKTCQGTGFVEYAGKVYNCPACLDFSYGVVIQPNYITTIC